MRCPYIAICIKLRLEVNKMSTGNNQDLELELKKYRRNKLICIIVGAAIFVGCIIGVIILNITLDKTAYEAMQAYEEGQISLAEYLKITDGLSILGIVRTGLSLLSTGGAALAIAGGIVNHVKAKNRTRKLKRRSIAEDYGGNGVEF